ncbi:MAG: hypothetical protein C0500_13410 [Sphingobium sp.]|nr:hypothetical protein [Sphingobium sp.]
MSVHPASTPALTPASTSVGDRRQFLFAAAASAGTLSALSFLGSPAGAASVRKAALSGGDIAVMNAAIAIEHEGIATYRIAEAANVLTADMLRAAQSFRGQHEGHRDQLAKMIRSAGGKVAEPKSDKEYEAAANMGTIKNEDAMLRLAMTVEKGAANAYFAQIAALKNPEAIKIFAQIGADEAAHWAALNQVMGEKFPTQPFMFG